MCLRTGAPLGKHDRDWHVTRTQNGSPVLASAPSFPMWRLAAQILTRRHPGPDCHLVSPPGPWGTLGPDFRQPDYGPIPAPSYAWTRCAPHTRAHLAWGYNVGAVLSPVPSAACVIMSRVRTHASRPPRSVAAWCSLWEPLACHCYKPRPGERPCHVGDARLVLRGRGQRGHGGAGRGAAGAQVAAWRMLAPCQFTSWASSAAGVNYWEAPGSARGGDAGAPA